MLTQRSLSTYAMLVNILRLRAAESPHERRGEAVGFLGLLDTQPHMAVYAKDDPMPVDELTAYIRRDSRSAFNSIPEREREALRQRIACLSEDERMEHAIRWAHERNFLSSEEADSSIGALKLGHSLAKEAARFMRASQADPIRAPIYAWWTTQTLERHGTGPVNWSHYTTGRVSVEKVIGDHMDAVQSIQVHQRITDILADPTHGVW